MDKLKRWRGCDWDWGYRRSKRGAKQQMDKEDEIEMHANAAWRRHTSVQEQRVLEEAFDGSLVELIARLQEVRSRADVEKLLVEADEILSK